MTLYKISRRSSSRTWRMARGLAIAAALPIFAQGFSMYASLNCDDALYSCGAGGASTLQLSVWTAMPIRLMPTCSVEFGDGVQEEFYLRSVDFSPTKMVSSVMHRYSVGGTFVLRACCGADCIEAELTAGSENAWAWLASSSLGSVPILSSSGPALNGSLALPLAVRSPGARTAAVTTSAQAKAGTYATFTVTYERNVTAWLVDTPLRVSTTSVRCERSSSSDVCDVSVTLWIEPTMGGQRSLPLCVHAAALPISTPAMLPLLQDEADFYTQSTSRCVLLDVESANEGRSTETGRGAAAQLCAAGLQPPAVLECSTEAAGCVGSALPDANRPHRPLFTAHGTVHTPAIGPVLLGAGAQNGLGALIASTPLPASAAEAGEWSITANVSLVGETASARTLALFVTRKLPGPGLLPEDELVRVDATGVQTAQGAHTEEPYTLAALLTREAGSTSFRASLVACDSASTTWESCRSLLSTSYAYVTLPCLQVGRNCMLQMTSVRAGADTSTLALLADGSLILNGTAAIMSPEASTTTRAGLSAEVAPCTPAPHCIPGSTPAGLAVHALSIAAGDVSPALSKFLWTDNVPTGSVLTADVSPFVYHLRTACGSLATSATAIQDAVAWITASQAAQVQITPCAVGTVAAICGYVARNAAMSASDGPIGVWVVGMFHAAALSSRPLGEVRSVDALRLSFTQGAWVASGAPGIQDVHLSAMPLPLTTIRTVFDLSLAIPVPVWVTTGPWIHSLNMNIAGGCGTISLGWTWSASNIPSPVLIARWRDIGYVNAGVWPVRVNASEVTARPQLALQSLLGVASIQMLSGQPDVSASLVTFCTGTTPDCAVVHPGASSTLPCPAGLPCVRTGRVTVGAQATVLIFIRDARGNVVDAQAVATLSSAVAVTLSNVTGYGASLHDVTVSPVAARTIAGVPALAFDVTFSAAAAQLSIAVGSTQLPLSPLWLVALPGEPSAPQSSFIISSCIGYGTVRSGRSGMGVVTLRDKDGMAIVEPQTLRALISSSRLRVELSPPAACASKVFGGSLTLSSATEGVLLVRFTALCAGVYGLRVTIDGQSLPTTYETSTCPMPSTMGPCPGLTSSSPLCVLPGTPVPALSVIQRIDGAAGTPGAQAVLTAGSAPATIARIRLVDAFGQTVPLSSLPAAPWPVSAPGEDVIVSVQAAWASNVSVHDTMDGSGWALVSASSTQAGQWSVVATLLSSGLATTEVQPLGTGTADVTVVPAALHVPRTLVSGTVTGVGQGELFAVEVMARDVYGNKRACTAHPEQVHADVLGPDSLPTNNATAVIQCDTTTGVQTVSVNTANLTVGSTIGVQLCSAVGVPVNTCPPVLLTTVGPTFSALMLKTETAWSGASYSGGAGLGSFTTRGADYMLPVAASIDDALAPISGSGAGLTSTVVNVASGGFTVLYGCACTGTTCSGACGSADDSLSRIHVTISSSLPPYTPAALGRTTDFIRSRDWWNAEGTTAGAQNVWTGVSAPVSVAVPAGLPAQSILGYSCRGSAPANTAIPAGAASVITALPIGDDHCFLYITGPRPAVTSACQLLPTGTDPACAPQASSVSIPVGPEQGIRIGPSPLNLLPYCNETAVPCSRLYLLDITQGSVPAGATFSVAMQVARPDGSLLPFADLPPASTVAVTITCAGVSRAFTRADAVPNTAGVEYLGSFVLSTSFTVAGLCTLDGDVAGQRIYTSVPILTVVPAQPHTVSLPAQGWQTVSPFAGAVLEPKIRVVDQYGNVLSWHTVGEWGVSASVAQGSPAAPVACTVSACTASTWCTDVSAMLQCSLVQPGAAVLDVTVGQVTLTHAFTIAPQLPSNLTTSVSMRTNSGVDLPLLTGAGIGFSGCVPITEGVPSSADSVPSCIAASSPVYEGTAVSIVNAVVSLRDKDGTAVPLAMPTGFNFRVCLHPSVPLSVESRGRSLCGQCTPVNATLDCPLVLPATAAGRTYIPHLHLVPDFVFASTDAGPYHPSVAATYTSLNGMALPVTSGGAPAGLFVAPVQVIARFMAPPDRQLLAPEGTVTARFQFSHPLVTGGTVRIPCPLVSSTVTPLFFLRHEPSGTLVSMTTNSWQCTGDTAEATLTPVLSSPAIIATHVSITAYIVTQNRAAGVAWPATPTMAAQRANVASTGVCLTGVGVVCQQHSSVLRVHYVTQASTATNFFSSGSHVAFTTSNSWTWFRDQLRITNGHTGNGTQRRPQIFDAANTTVVFRNSAGMRMTGFHGPMSYSTAPVYSVRVSVGRTTDNTPNPVSVPNALSLPGNAPCFDFLYEDPATLAPSGNQVSSCHTQGTDTAHSMYLPGDRDAARYASWAAGNSSSTVDFARMSYLMEMAQMELESSTHGDTLLNQFFLRMAAWSNPTDWANGAVGSIPGSRNNVEARFTSALSGAGIWGVPQGTYTNPSRFRVQRGPDDFRATSNLQAFVAGLGAGGGAGSVLRELEWNKKQIRRKHLKHPDYPPAVHGAVDDIFRIVPRYKDAVNRPILDVNLPNFRTSYARGLAYNRSVWHARQHITPIFKGCHHRYREGNVIFDGNPTIDGTKYGWWAFNTRLDEAGQSGKPCAWIPLAVHSTLGLLDTRAIEPVGNSASERAVAFQAGAAADLMQPWGGDRFPLDVLALPVYPVNMPSHVRPVIAGTGLSASTHPNDTSTYPGRKSATGAYERAVRVFWVDMDGDPAAGANMATGYSNPCRSELHPFDDLGIGMAAFEADTSLSPVPRPLVNVTIRLVGNGTHNMGKHYFSLTYVPRIGSPEWPQGSNPSAQFVDRCGEQDQMYLYSGPDGRSLFNCSTLETCASEIWTMKSMQTTQFFFTSVGHFINWNFPVGALNTTHTRRYLFQWQVVYNDSSRNVPEEYPGVRVTFSAHRRFRAPINGTEGYWSRTTGLPTNIDPEGWHPTNPHGTGMIASVRAAHIANGASHMLDFVRRHTPEGRTYLVERYMTPLLPTELGYTDSSFSTPISADSWTNRTLAPQEIDDEGYDDVWCEPPPTINWLGRFSTRPLTQFDGDNWNDKNGYFPRACVVGHDCVCFVVGYRGFNGTFPFEQTTNRWQDERFNAAMLYYMDKNYEIRPEWIGNHSMEGIIFNIGERWWNDTLNADRSVMHSNWMGCRNCRIDSAPGGGKYSRHGVEQPARDVYSFMFIWKPVMPGRLPLSLYIRDRRMVFVPEVLILPFMMHQNISQVYADPVPFQPTKPPYAPIHPRIATRAGWPSTLHFLIRDRHGHHCGDDLLICGWNSSFINYTYQFNYTGPLVSGDDDPYTGDVPSCQVIHEHKIRGYQFNLPAAEEDGFLFDGWQERAGRNNNWSMNMTYVCNRAGWWNLTVMAGQWYYNQSRSFNFEVAWYPNGTKYLHRRGSLRSGWVGSHHMAWWAFTAGREMGDGGFPRPIGRETGMWPIRIQVAPAFQPFAREHDEAEQPSHMHLVGSRELVLGTCSDWYMRMKDLYGNSHVAELPWNVVHTFRPYWRPLWIFNDDPSTAVPAFRYEHALASTLTSAGGNEFSYNVGPTMGSNPNTLWRGYIGHGTLRVRACAIGPGFTANSTVTLAIQYHSKAVDGLGNTVVHPARWITPTTGNHTLTMKVRLVSGAPSVHTSTWMAPTLPDTSSVPTGGCHFTMPAGGNVAAPSTWDLATVTVNLTDSFGLAMTDLTTSVADFTTAGGAPWLRAYVLEEESGWTALMDRTLSHPSTVTFRMPMSQIASGDGLAVAQAGGTFKVFVFIGDGMLRSANRADAYSMCFSKARLAVVATSSVSGLDGSTTVRAGQAMALHVQLQDAFGNDAVNTSVITAAATFTRLLADGASTAAATDAQAVLHTGLVPGRHLLSGTAPAVAGFYRVQATVVDGNSSSTYSTNLTVLPLSRASSVCIESVGPCNRHTFCSVAAVSTLQSCPGRLGIDVTAAVPRLLRPVDSLVLHVRGLDSFGNEVRDTNVALPSAVTLEVAVTGHEAVNHTLVCPSLHNGAKVCTLSLANAAVGPLTVSVYSGSALVLRFSSSLLGGSTASGTGMLAPVRAGATIGSNVLLQSSLNLTGYIASSMHAACSAAATLGLDTSSIGVSPVTRRRVQVVETSIVYNASGAQAALPSFTAPGPMSCAMIDRSLFVLTPEPGVLTINSSATTVSAAVGAAISPAPSVAIWGSGLVACRVHTTCTFRLALRSSGSLALGEPQLLQPRSWGASATACVSVRGATSRSVCISNLHSLHLTGSTATAALDGSFSALAASGGLDFLSLTLNLTGTASQLLLPLSDVLGRPSTEVQVSVHGLTIGPLVDQTVETAWRTVQVHATTPSLLHSALHFVNRSRTWIDHQGTLTLGWASAQVATFTPTAVPQVLKHSQHMVIVTLRDAKSVPILRQRPSDGVHSQLILGTSTVYTPPPPQTALTTPQVWYLGGASYAVVVPPLTVGASTLRISLFGSADSVDVPLHVVDESDIAVSSDAAAVSNVTVATGTGFSALPDVVRPASVSCRAGASCSAVYTCRPAQLAGILSARLTASVAVPAVTASSLGANVANRYYRVLDVPAEVTVDSANGGCSIRVSTMVNVSGTHGLAVFFGGQQLTSVVPMIVRPQNQPAVNGDYEWPAQLYSTASTVSGLVRASTRPVDVLAVDVYGNPTGVPTDLSFLTHACTTSTPTVNAAWAWNGALMKHVVQVQVQSAMPCLSLTAVTPSPFARTQTLSVGCGVVIGWPAVLPIDTASGRHPQHLVAIPVSGPSPAASFSALLLSDAAKDVDAHIAGLALLPPVPAQDIIFIRTLMHRLAGLTAQDRLPAVRSSMDADLPVCPILHTLREPLPACVPQWYVVPDDVPAHAVASTNSSMLDVLHLTRVQFSESHVAVWLSCPVEDPVHVPALAVLPSGRPYTLRHSGTGGDRAWYMLPPVLATGKLCLSKELGMETHGLQERCVEVVQTVVDSAAPVVDCSAEAAQGSSACATGATEMPFLCPRWAPYACNDGTCASSQAHCPVVPVHAAASWPNCPDDAPVRCGAYAPHNHLSCVHDSWACTLLARPIVGAERPVCPSGTALCSPYAGVADQSPCVPVSSYPSGCPTPITCGPHRSRCWDGYCYEKSALQLAAEALLVRPENISALLRSVGGSMVAATPTCPLLSGHRTTTPTLGKVRCPSSKPVRCEDGSCAYSEGACLGGHVHAYSNVVEAAVAGINQAIAQPSGSTSLPQAWSAFTETVQRASASMRDVASCSGFSASMANSSGVGPIRLPDGTCASQLAHGLVSLAECTGSTPVLCPGGVICASSEGQCAAIAPCPSEEPWACIALGGKCTSSRAACAAAAVDPIGVLANDLRGAAVRETSSTVWTTTLQIALLALLAVFVGGTILGLVYLWKHHKKHVKKHAAEHVRMTTQERDVEEKGSRSSKHESRSSRQDYPPSPTAEASGAHTHAARGAPGYEDGRGGSVRLDAVASEVSNPMIVAKGAGAMPRMPLASQKGSAVSRVSMQLQQFVRGDTDVPAPTLLEESDSGGHLQPVAEGGEADLDESGTGAAVRGLLAERLRRAYSAVQEVEEEEEDVQAEAVGQRTVEGSVVTNPLAMAQGSEQQRDWSLPSDEGASSGHSSPREAQSSEEH